MKKFLQRRSRFGAAALAALATSLCLTACGGGGSSGVGVSTPPHR